jgi:Mycobacterium membrane protein
MRWGAAGLAMILAGTGLAWQHWSHGDDKGKIFRTSTAQVTYEVLGSGTSPRVEYVNGPDNQQAMAMHVTLPWRMTLSMPVGLAGAVADMTAAYPDSGKPVTCRILIGDRVVRQTVSDDGFSDAACSTVVPAMQQK